MAQLKKIGILSAAKISSAIGLIVGLVYAVLILVAGGAIASLFGPVISKFIGLGIALLVALPALEAIGSFIGVAIIVFLYNVMAARVGGVEIDLKRGKLNRVGPMSLAKIAGVVGVIAGLIVGCIVAVAAAAMAPGSAAIVAIVVVAFTTLFSAIIYFLMGLIGAFVYNALASMIGGLELGITKGELKSIGIASYVKISAALGAIEGVLVGILYFALGSNAQTSVGLPSAVAALGILNVVVFPVLYLVLGAVGAALGGYLYNKLTGSMGGVRLEIG
ncbi:Uncharacterised protein [uncultured archaeon]|nr:Uncharacterised protein [uncultured archaeon]